MSSPSKSPSTNNKINNMPLTIEGLPLDHTQSASRTTDSNGGPHRRVECRPNTQLQQLPSPTSLRTPPTKNSTTPRKANNHILRADNNRRSLIDDDDDELIDYFGRAHDMKGPSYPAAAEADASPTTSLTSSQWNVQSNNIPTLPSFYPIEKSSVYISDGTSPSVISSRISSILTSRSITTSYNSTNAYVDCVTSKGVEFRIRLYHDKGEDGIIIVEVQRRKGFDISYMNDLHAILDGAEGKVDQELEGNSSISIPPSCNEEGNSGLDKEDGERLASLRVISSILCPPPPQQDQEDEGSIPQETTLVTVEAQDIALSSLISLTSIKSMGDATAQEISNELLTSDAYGYLRSIVFGNVSSSEQAQDPPPVARGEGEWSTLQSLEILSNVATSLSPCNKNLLVKLLSQNNGEMLHRLIVNIENASGNPRAASLSCIVLENVWDVSFSEYKERVTMALQDAKSCGRKFYAELERHAQVCLDQLLCF